MSGTELPVPTGRFGVGRTKFDLMDEARAETLDPDGCGGKRELVVWVWYPARPGEGDRAVRYLPEGWERSDDVVGMQLGTDVLTCHSVEDAPLEASEAPYPVVLFSASGFSPLSYAALVEDLASHGYVVMSVCHTYEAPVTVFGDGRAMFADPAYMTRIAYGRGAYQDEFRFRAEVAELKRDDLRFVASQLGNLPAPLEGHLDLDRVGAFGHSLGGNAALGFCRIDDRCRAAVNLDGGNWGDVGDLGLAKPALIVASEHPEMLAPAEQMVAAGAYPDVEWCLADRASLFDGWQKVVETGRPGSIVTIEGARHASFADVQFVLLAADSPLRAIMGPIEPRSMWRQTSDLLLGFFGEHLVPRA